MNNKGLHWLQIDATQTAPPVVFRYDESLQKDKFSQVMALCRELSDGQPFRPEWMFNKELPEDIKLYLRNIFMQRIKGLDIGRGLSDDDLLEFSPKMGETLNSFADRVYEFVQSVKTSDNGQDNA